MNRRNTLQDIVEVIIPDVVILNTNTVKHRDGETTTKVRYRSHDLREHTTIDPYNTKWKAGEEGDLVFRWVSGYDRNNKHFDEMKLINFVAYDFDDD